MIISYDSPGRLYRIIMIISYDIISYDSTGRLHPVPDARPHL